MSFLPTAGMTLVTFTWIECQLLGNIGLVSYTIGELSEDLSVLRKFRDPFGHLDDCTPTWWQALTRNPAAHPDDLAIIFAVDGDIVVGRLGLWAGTAVINGTKTRTFLLTLFVLNEDYRSTGAGGMMFLRAISHSPCLVAAGPIPPEVQRIYLATGFQELGPFPRYVHFYSTKAIFRKFLGNHWICSVLSFLTTPLLRLYHRMRRKSFNGALEFKPVTSFGDNIESLSRQGNYFSRDSATLNWVLGNRDNLHGFEVFRSGRFSGYCLLRVAEAPAQSSPRRLPAMRVGSLLDYYIEGATEDDKRALIDLCLDFFRPKETDIFECLTNDGGMGQVCLKLGMIQIGGFRVMFRPPRGISGPLQEPWFLTQGEGDVILGQEGFSVPSNQPSR